MDDVERLTGLWGLLCPVLSGTTASRGLGHGRRGTFHVKRRCNLRSGALERIITVLSHSVHLRECRAQPDF